MMSYVLEMSTEADIVHIQTTPSWIPVSSRSRWAVVQDGGLDIPNGATIVVITHGNNNAIGNATPGVIDITGAAFLALILSNMVTGAAPAYIYISSYGHAITEFAVNVALTAQANFIWFGTRIFAYNTAVAGPVPAANNPGWTEIYARHALK